MPEILQLGRFSVQAVNNMHLEGISYFWHNLVVKKEFIFLRLKLFYFIVGPAANDSEVA